jgi:putative transposase
MDVTIFRPLDNTRIYIYLLIDNFSRSILSWTANTRFSSSIALSVLRDFTDNFDLEPQAQLITDGGPENCGELSKFTSSTDRIIKMIAQKDIIQSNSMVEAVNKHIKYYYLFKKDLKDYQETVNYLKGSIPDYNQKPHGTLYGLTPSEVLNGEIPSRDQFTDEKLRARKIRLMMNQKMECCERD